MKFEERIDVVKILSMICGLALAVAAVLAVSAWSQGKMTKTASGLQYADQMVGTGDTAMKGMKVDVHYTGWLYSDGKRGKKFDSSVDRGKPFTFTLGAGDVIKGWDEGVQGMKVGGKRELIIPPSLGYGSRGVGNGLIPPDSTLNFEVELLKVSK
jgi:FKBP-type peptidyl-prolyl cis-trans isomerase